MDPNSCMCGVNQALYMFDSEESLPCKTHYDNVSFHFDYIHECSIHCNNIILLYICSEYNTSVYFQCGHQHIWLCTDIPHNEYPIFLK